MRWRLDPGQIEVVAAVLRRMSPAERLAIVADANRTARALVAAGGRRRHPDWPEPLVEQEVAGTLACEQVTDELARRASEEALARAVSARLGDGLTPAAAR